jgi:hypothetical protein
MPLDPKIIQIVKSSQERVFRLAKRDHGLTLKAISLDSGIDYDSVCNYAKGDTQMPLSALNALCGIIPNELLSLLLPERHLIVVVPDGIDHDELDAACREYLKAKAAAHHPNSPGAREISDCENVVLLEKAAKLKAVAA